ncbi:MAG: Exopolysaccharide biosynthesis polyprenyl glycosylphosphotransferase [Candidatus Jorgensenbacteria bacterium GW2011_GWA1_48_13]|uniref:Exopolysaccharide biosynthesis polyprenyl glycosylphosphotransferase n=1 Tax=Candidatus Jorgensenbacteria bacterium GW2011_GWB1_50_10 TaxID=1618665 RepID=A0A0G1W8S9_9BACT|nr:MAG: Exopolysaccharide biosynthesis polyprenyl glycosylphosphotransferase [Candidatus Jorgensenbacteria bacterium GW2011_GWA1_48_13]KKW15113.1 MAG: Exopolysaccharide biosynthesis polyprenyl glycosylphosphotransferase [Candidatus Jorgensenbacteria bacterium GW2011_GWB1_50_10]
MKRTSDIIGSVFGLLFILPFTPFIALAIVLESGLPVFVRLDRVSNGKIIKVYKFRTMVQDAHSKKSDLAGLNERKDGPFFKIKNDPRLTRVGKWLRKLRLDEFPQFLNVLRGDLTLVGPRPHEPAEMEKYPTEFKGLYFVKAGLTGLSQVSGASGLPFRKELELDIYYVEHQSFWFDLKILAKTVWIFFSDPTGV